MKYKLQIHSKRLLADTLTPVNIYLKVRDLYAGSILLESSDYHGHENSRSFICCDPIASFRVKDEQIEIHYPDKTKSNIRITSGDQVIDQLEAFRTRFEVVQGAHPFDASGLFGYMTYDAVRFFEDVDLAQKDKPIPDILFKVYRYVIGVDHFSNALTLFENVCGDVDLHTTLDNLEKVIFSHRFSTFPFTTSGIEIPEGEENEFLAMVESGIQHCHRGDIFQIVLSRKFNRVFKGDEFNVYRALRSINPSPYLFYFDYGSYKIFGSSPEAQIRITDRQASIYPIAGTFRRSGDDQEDAAIATRLSQDEKESAEHVMLVDLARNDLSRDADQVKVEVFKEIQYYSHVIHLVSRVTGKLRTGASTLKQTANTFPAGTLSGAPKPMAMKLIEKYEKSSRSFYGGTIGFIGFNGDVNLAIMIRTFLSKDNTLTYQAGAGIVARSIPARELQEVNNKLEALRMAVTMAQKI